MKKKTLKLILETLAESNCLLLEHNKRIDRALIARNKDMNALYVERDSVRDENQRLRRENRELRSELPQNVIVGEAL